MCPQALTDQNSFTNTMIHRYDLSNQNSFTRGGPPAGSSLLPGISWSRRPASGATGCRARPGRRSLGSSRQRLRGDSGASNHGKLGHTRRSSGYAVTPKDCAAGNSRAQATDDLAVEDPKALDHSTHAPRSAMRPDPAGSERSAGAASSSKCDELHSGVLEFR